MRAIILAGGKGTRLRPYTYVLPKPLMPIGGERPILEIIIKQLKNFGFDRITIAVNYMANIIQALFDNGNNIGVNIDYSLEKKPLGTVGPLTIIDDLPENFFVMNGDLLTDLNYKEFYQRHINNKNDITVATHQKKYQDKSGVLKFNENFDIIEFVEKPISFSYINMGIYCLNRKVIEALPKNEPCGFDTVIKDAITNKLKVKAYVHTTYWLDIGRTKDYRAANNFYLDHQDKFLKTD